MNLMNDFVTFSISILKKKKRRKKKIILFIRNISRESNINNEINYGKNFDCKNYFPRSSG